MAEISALSNETVWVAVTFTHPVDGAADPTDYDVELALVAEGNPAETDWHPASWATGTDPSGRYVAYFEVGPDADTVELAAGVYRMWARLTLPTETPVVAGEFLTVI